MAARPGPRPGRRPVTLTPEQNEAHERLVRAAAEQERLTLAFEVAIVEAGVAVVPRQRVIESSRLSKNKIWKIWKAADVPTLPGGTGHLQLSDEQQKILRRIETLAAQIAENEKAFSAALLDCGRTHVPQGLVSDASGYQRERIRQLWRKAGIPSPRD
ncbi:hypothetical protein [Actinomadura sp. K4S16]|uniref:hypothetical protein n=1 Tax=Actinomadura sp. K4S16 TaxID=1316147 RepID=UPI0011ED1F35|nr:hypothetical protein [Actinomadura sp. K4S16]